MKIFPLIVLLAMFSCQKKSSSSDGGDQPSTSIADSNSPHTTTDRTISINWSEIDTGGTNLVGYYIFYVEGDVPPPTCEGPNRVTVSDPTETEAFISGLEPGTQYSFRVCGFDNEGEVFTNDSSTFTATTQAPGPEGTQYIAALGDPTPSTISLTGNVVEATLAVTCSENGSAKIFNNADDATIVGVTPVNAGVLTNLTITAAAVDDVTDADGIYRLKVHCCDVAGENCAIDTTNEITLDTTAPPDIGDFTASSGSLAGNIDLVVALPSDISDYDSIKIYRSDANEGAAPACGSGTLVDESTDFSASPINRTITSLQLGGTYHFVACIHDLVNNVKTFATTPSAVAFQTAGTQFVFISEASANGNPDGAGTNTDLTLVMDAACQSEGDLGLVSGRTWQAFVSSTSNTMRVAADLVTATGAVYLVDSSTKIANDKTDLFDGSIGQKLNMEADGDIVSDGIEYWTGSLSDGTTGAADNCSGWDEDNENDEGEFGIVGAVDATWLEVPGNANEDCDEVRRWLCISN